ncbi:hypothetical protein ABIB68_007200, partial [Bradyrhizobium sp. F1.2.2]
SASRLTFTQRHRRTRRARAHVSIRRPSSYAYDEHSITMMVLLLDGAIMRYNVLVVDSSRRVICAAKLDCVDEQAARRRAEQCVASTTLSFGKAIDLLLCSEVQRRTKTGVTARS